MLKEVVLFDKHECSCDYNIDGNYYYPEPKEYCNFCKIEIEKITDFSILKNIIRFNNNTRIYDCLNSVFKNNKKIILWLVEKNGYEFDSLPDALKNDREIVFEFLKWKNFSIDDIGKDFCIDNKNIIDCIDLLYVDGRFGIIKNSNHDILKQINKFLREMKRHDLIDDIDFLLQISNKIGLDFIVSKESKLWKDLDFCISQVSIDSECYEFVSERIKVNEIFIKKMLDLGVIKAISYERVGT